MKSKKSFILTIAVGAIFLASPSAFAQSNSQAKSEHESVTVIDHPKKVVITEKNGKTYNVSVIGRKDNDEYSYNKTISIGDQSSSIEKEKNTSWDFNLPFISKKKKKNPSTSEDIGGIGLGLVNATGAPSDMNVNMGASWEIMFDHLLRLKYYPFWSRTSFSIGFGMTWRNYRMNGYNRFDKDNSNIIISSYPENADISYSRLKVFSLTMPLMWNQPLNDKVDFSLGPVVNFNTHGSMRTVYKLDGKSIKDSNKEIHQNPVTVDIMAALTFKSIGLYFKYSPTKVLNTDFGPEFHSLSTGITLFY